MRRWCAHYYRGYCSSLACSALDWWWWCSNSSSVVSCRRLSLSASTTTTGVTICEAQQKVAGWISRSLANFPAGAGVIGSVDAAAEAGSASAAAAAAAAAASASSGVAVAAAAPDASAAVGAPAVSGVGPVAAAGEAVTATKTTTTTTTTTTKQHRNPSSLPVAGRPYLIWFAHEHVEFRHAELESLIELFGATRLNFVGRQLEGRRLWMTDESESGTERPWLVVNCEDEQDLVRICSRSILIRHVSELMAEGDSLQDVVDQLREKQIEPHSDTFRFEVEAFGKRKIPRCDKIAKMELFDFLPFNGEIDLQRPTWTYHIIEYYGQESNCVPNQPFKVFFGRQVAEGQRELVTRLSLKNREFIANTSMDPTLSVLMSNIAQVRDADLVYDPFVGSASLLVAAALHKAYVIGMDIDFMLLHGRTKPSRYNEQRRKEGESVRSNLRQYGCSGRYLDVVVGDSSRPVFHWRPLFDAILTDPPYGIRESTERVGSKTSPHNIPGHLASQHIPTKVSYSLPDVISDLMRFAVASLQLGRRLVFWMPVYREDFLCAINKCRQQQLQQNQPNRQSNEHNGHTAGGEPVCVQDLHSTAVLSALPSHPCLRLVCASEQRLTSHSSRILLTYEKVRDPKGHTYEVSPGAAAHSAKFRDRYFAKRSEQPSHSQEGPNS